LQQVEAALIPEPDNADLIKLRDDLNEIISLQEELVNGDNEDKAAKASKRTAAPSSSGSSDKQISWKVGDRCMAPSKNGQFYLAVIDGISQDKVAITFLSNGVKHMVKRHELKIAPTEDKKDYIFKTNNKANSGANQPKKEWQLERERRKFRAQKKEIRRKTIDEAKEQQKSSWQNFNKKATNKSLKGIKRIETPKEQSSAPRTGASRSSANISSRADNRFGATSRGNMDSLF